MRTARPLFLATPWGNARAHLAAHGVLLAPRGSIRDSVMIEVARRERSEKFAFARLITSTLCRTQSVHPDTVASMLEMYRLELSQDLYHPDMAALLRATVASQKTAARAQQAILNKVDKMTVPEDQIPKAPKQKGKRHRRR